MDDILLSQYFSEINNTGHIQNRDCRYIPKFYSAFCDKKPEFNYYESLAEAKSREKQTKSSRFEQKPTIPTFEGLKVAKVEVPEQEGFKQRQLMKDKIIPDMASSIVIVGGTGSGKTNLLVNMLQNKDMYKDYFDVGEIYLFSANGKSDELLMSLGLPDERIITDRKSMIKELEGLMNRLKDRCEKEGKYKTKKACIIFEDLTSIKKLQDSEPFIKLFTENRHHAVMVFALVHKYKGLNRTCRLQAHNLIIFPCQESDVKQLVEDHLPPGIDKKTFIKAITEYIWKPEDDNPKPFLHINTKSPNETRYRKSFDTIVDLLLYKKHLGR